MLWSIFSKTSSITTLSSLNGAIILGKENAIFILSYIPLYQFTNHFINKFVFLILPPVSKRFTFASLKAIATACFGLVTVFPEDECNVPSLNSCITTPILFCCALV